jgi:hypothetical protein
MSETVKPKTLQELIELFNSFPRGRRIVGYASTAGFFVFLLALCFAVYFRTGFVTYLILAFLMFLCTSHSNYAFAQNLTQRKVRRIDYWYLGAATFGLLLFAAAYSNQREAVLTKMFVIAHQTAEEPIREKVVASLATLSEFLCSAEIVRSSPKPCEGLKTFSVEIKPHLSAEQIESLKEKFRSEVGLPYGRMFSLEQLRTRPSLFSPLSVVQVRLGDWAEFMKDAPSQSASQRDEQSEVMFGLGQWVIWPFLLAYALALRITKVTVDVFEWAK